MGICGAHGCHRNLDRRVDRAGGRGAAFLLPKSGAVMKRHQALSVAVALALWAGAAHAMPPESEPAPGLPSRAADRARWIPVEARNHAGVSGQAAVLFGVAHERG